ncbi:FAD-dependent oxidoreductase [Alloscardovia venturai]|uniref:FAD-dependent oxidoreductase n=1 Tax=Alloscardovia venturai TaxID=1769421 RepID=A0ABW2Y2V0_9BIFI
MTTHIALDVLVIGWGKAGKTLAAKLSATRKVGLVEQYATMYGGTCINIGCVPTKALITSASRHVDSSSTDADYFEKSVAHRNALIEKMRAKNHSMLEGKVLLIDGKARFSGPHSVVIEPSNADDSSRSTHDSIDESAAESITVSAPIIIINTGAVTRIPDIPGTDLPHVYTSTSIQHAQPFPQSLTIIGGGFIGLEFATMMNDFGSHVTILDSSDVFLSRLDRDVADKLYDTMTAQGIEIISRARVEKISQADNGQLTVYTSADAFTSDAVLLATGRTAATANLNLDAAGIEVDSRGSIVVDDHLRTNVEGVYAVGDVNGGPQFTYISFDDHRIVLDDIIGNGTRVRSDRVAVPTASFVRPPLSSVGMTEDEARAAGRNIVVKKADIADIAVMPRPKIIGSPEGMAKFILDADTDEILGAVLYCVDSQELINTVALAMRLHAPASMLRDGIWTHPASTEVFNGVL